MPQSTGLGAISQLRFMGWYINSRDMSLSKLQKIVKNREAWLSAGHGIIKSWT